jgi:hypothetical protein
MLTRLARTLDIHVRYEYHHRRGVDSSAYNRHIPLEHEIGRTPRCNGILLYPSTVSIGPNTSCGLKFVLTSMGKNHPRYNLPDYLHPTHPGSQLHPPRVPLLHLRPGGPVSQLLGRVYRLLLALHQVHTGRPGTVQRHPHDCRVSPVG